MKTRKKILLSIISVIVFVASICLLLLFENKSIVTTEIDVVSDRLPEAFSGYRIVQVSDLHNEEFGEDNKRLIEKIKEAEPDIIVMTGDMIDVYEPEVDVAIDFAENMMKIAPTYFVTGNHESKTVEYHLCLDGYKKAGITILDNKKVYVEKDKEKINLLGIDDQNFFLTYLNGTNEENITTVLNKMMQGVEGYTILLAHRPENINIYSSFDIDLVLSGHAHGGQIKLPFAGGLRSPGQGWFPEYYEGLHNVGDTQMIVSRGLGNSAFPFRFNNRPEIIIVELKTNENNEF